MRPTQEHINKLKAALPLGAIQGIAQSTGLPYQLTYNVLTNRIRRWDERHDRVISAAVEVIEKSALAITEKRKGRP